MVRYADGPKAEVEISLSSPPERVWPYLVDINLPASFSNELQGAQWDDEGPALGARFTGHNRYDQTREWSTSCLVTAFEPNRTFEWTVGEEGPNRVARWRFDLNPEGDGSRLRFSAEMGPGPSGLTSSIEKYPDKEERIVANRLAEWESNMTRTVEGIKQRAESETTESNQ